MVQSHDYQMRRMCLRYYVLEDRKEFKPVLDDRYQQFGEEAGNRGLDCGTGKPKVKLVASL